MQRTLTFKPHINHLHTKYNAYLNSTTSYSYHIWLFLQIPQPTLQITKSRHTPLWLLSEQCLLRIHQTTLKCTKDKSSATLSRHYQCHPKYRNSCRKQRNFLFIQHQRFSLRYTYKVKTTPNHLAKNILSRNFCYKPTGMFINTLYPKTKSFFDLHLNSPPYFENLSPPLQFMQHPLHSTPSQQFF